MKFSDHLGKGAWALASRGLPFLYAVTLIFVARELPREQFGILGVFQTLFTILFSFSDHFALQAIVKFGFEEDMNLEELVGVTSTLFAGFIFGVLSILLLFAGFFSELLSIPELEALFPYLALLTVVTMPRVVFSKILQMHYRMRELFFIDAANFAVASIVIIVGLRTGFITSAQSVIIVTICAGLLSSLVATFLVRDFYTLGLRFSRTVFHRIIDFVRFQAAGGVVSVLQQNFDTLVVASFTGAAGAGTYQGAKMIYRGFDVVRDTLVLFIFPATSKYHARGDTATLRNMFEKAVSFLYLLLIPVSVLLFVLAPYLFEGIWGNKYLSSVPVFRVLLLASLFLPMQMIFGFAMTGMGKVKEAFLFSLAAFAVNVIAALLLIPSVGVIGAAIAFIVAGFAQSILLNQYVCRNTGFSNRAILSRGVSDALQFARSVRTGKSK